MDNWNDLAQNNRKAALDLVQDQYHRSSISRAYYAVYSKVTMELVLRGVSMPAGRDGPSHQKLRPLIISKLMAMNLAQRRALSRVVGRLYDLRVAADYQPTFKIDARDVREAIALMNKVFDNL